MKIIEVITNNKISKIFIGETLKNLKKYLPEQRKIIIITDENIVKYYYDLIENYPIIVIGQGEENKTLKTVEYIFEKLIEFEADRSTFIVAIGGGIVTDVAGFAASIYMRGLKFGFVSTTLLAQVDASVGGKNGVNFHRYKNMIGVFNQPNFVLCDIDSLKTLERREFIAGFAEIIKAAAIRNADFFEFLEKNIDKALDYDYNVIEHLIYESVLIKAKIVENDEKEEKGERRILNFGHTFAHAYEKLSKNLLHGEAVAIGMVMASKLSKKLGFLSQNEVDRITCLIKNSGLPVSIEFKINDIVDAMRKDKKRENEFIHFVLLNKIGNAFTYLISINQLEEIVYDLCADN